MKLFFVLLFSVIPCLANAGQPKPWEMYFQESATPLMDMLYTFHNQLMFIITAITVLVISLITYVCIKFNKKANPIPNKFSHNVKIEVIWTAIPLLILAFISVPSLKALYYADVIPESEMTLKVVAHQWYWEYLYPGEKIEDEFGFDSYYIKDEDLKPGQLRLLEVDNQVVLPVDTVVKVLVTSADVIHSWAVPAFGVKIDAIPGRTNETWVKIKKPGVYYGQCSQLCGVGHGFMPIAVRAVEKEEYKKWLSKARKDFALSKQIQLTSNN